MTQWVELADKVCPCSAMSTGAYWPNDATWSYRCRHWGFCWCFEFDHNTRHVPSLAQVFEGPIYNHPFKVYFTKKTHFTEYFKIIKTSEVHVPCIPPENVKLVIRPWPYAKNTVYLNVTNRNWRVEGHHFYCPVHNGGQVKSLLPQKFGQSVQSLSIHWNH